MIRLLLMLNIILVGCSPQMTGVGRKEPLEDMHPLVRVMELKFHSEPSVCDPSLFEETDHESTAEEL